MSHLLIQADARRIPLADASIHTVITSPPYWGLRDYQTGSWVAGDPDCDHLAGPLVSSKSGLRNDGRDHVGPYKGEKAVTAGMPYRNLCGKCGARRIDAQIGLEPTPEAYVASIMAVFHEIWRVLRNDGTAWLNLGDSYVSHKPRTLKESAQSWTRGSRTAAQSGASKARDPRTIDGLKDKDLIGIPWRCALALQAEGWYLRDAIVWAKGEVDEDNNLEGCPMPGSQRDRCTSAYEFVFQLAKSQRYYFDQEAIKTSSGAILRNVWRINPEPWKGAHFATFPRKLVEPCIRAGTSERGACPQCGSPWERVTNAVKYEPEVVGVGERFVDASRGDKVRKLNGKSKEWKESIASRSTLGWHPTCTCPAAEPVPCVVFDPFSGVSTTGVVALALNRHYIGLDLSTDYLAQAKRRLERPHQPVTKQREQAHPLFAHMEDVP